MNKKIVPPYTKTGDNGKTFLPGVGRVDKHHHMIEFIGTMDELVSILGACISHLSCREAFMPLLSFMLPEPFADGQNAN